MASALAGLGVDTRPRWWATRATTWSPRVAHGLHGVGVTWGIGTEDELREAGADVVVDRPEELAAAV